MVRTFPCPVNVSPLIRASRWLMLFTGIGYGAYHQVAFQRREDQRKQNFLKTIQKTLQSHPENENAEHTAAEIIFITPAEIEMTTATEAVCSTPQEATSISDELPTPNGLDPVIAPAVASATTADPTERSDQ